MICVWRSDGRSGRAQRTVPRRFIRARLGVAGVTFVYMPLARTSSQDHTNCGPVERRGCWELLARKRKGFGKQLVGLCLTAD